MTGRPTNLKLDDQLCFALYAAANSVTRAYRPLLARIGLTYPQYLVMLVLWQDGDHAVHEIADRSALPAHALSPLLDRMERAGLVVRRRGAPDRRVVNVSLTPAGEALEVAAAQAQETVACRTRDGDAPTDDLREQLHALVRRMSPPDPYPATGTTIREEAPCPTPHPPCTSVSAAPTASRAPRRVQVPGHGVVHRADRRAGLLPGP